MRTDLVFGQGRVGETDPSFGSVSVPSAFGVRYAKRVRIPPVGFGLAAARAFNAAGVGSFRLATGGTGIDHPGDSAKARKGGNRAAKSSTMKGPTEYVREGLPVRFRGDGARPRTSVRERYPELLDS